MPGDLRGIYKSDCISPDQLLMNCPQTFNTSPSSLSADGLAPQFTEKTEAVRRGHPLATIARLQPAHAHSQLKDVLPAIVSSLSCLNSSQAAEGGLLGPSGQAPWLGCGSLPKVGAPFALSE